MVHPATTGHGSGLDRRVWLNICETVQPDLVGRVSERVISACGSFPGRFGAAVFVYHWLRKYHTAPGWTAADRRAELRHDRHSGCRLYLQQLAARRCYGGYADKLQCFGRPNPPAIHVSD